MFLKTFMLVPLRVDLILLLGSNWRKALATGAAAALCDDNTRRNNRDLVAIILVL